MKRTLFHQERRTGTTLVEVMAAATLSVLLLGALTLAMQTLSRHETVMLSHDRASTAWQRNLQSILEWDIVNSRQWNQRVQSLRLTGYTGRDAEGHPLLTPHEVTYRFMTAGDDIWLIRESVPVPSHPDGVVDRTILCRGVTKILIGRPEDDLATLLAPRAEFDTFYPIPSRIRCVLVNSDNQTILDFVAL